MAREPSSPGHPTTTVRPKLSVKLKSEAAATTHEDQGPAYVGLSASKLASTASKQHPTNGIIVFTAVGVSPLFDAFNRGLTPQDSSRIIRSVVQELTGQAILYFLHIPKISYTRDALGVCFENLDNLGDGHPVTFLPRTPQPTSVGLSDTLRWKTDGTSFSLVSEAPS